MVKKTRRGAVLRATSKKSVDVKLTTSKPLRMKTAIAKMVKQQISKAAEDKFAGITWTNAFNSTVGSSSECYPLVPDIAPGTGDNQRIGDKVKGKYLYVKGFVQWNGAFMRSSQYGPPCTVRAMVLSQKNIKVASAVQSSVDVAHLLKDNVSTGVARSYGGGMFDNLAPINKDLFRVHLDKKMRLNYQTAQTVPVGGVSPEWQSGNNLTKYFSCRIKVPNTLTFDDGNINVPNNFAPFFCFGAVADDNSGPFLVGTPWEVNVQSILYYEDS